MILINKRRTSTSLARRPTYLARMARSADEVRAAQRLRFEVFNLELNEGLAESHFTGLDIDPFDAVCQHLVVENVPTVEIVGPTACKRASPRRQTSATTASANLISRLTNPCVAK